VQRPPYPPGSDRAARLSRLNRIEHHGGRVRSVLRPHDIDVGPVGPDRQLFDRRSAEGIRRAHIAVVCPTPSGVRELPDRRGLSRPLTADNERDVRRMAVRRRRSLIDGVEDRADFILDEIAKAFRQAGAIANGAHDLLRGSGRRHRRKSELFERLNRVNVDRAHALFLGIGALHNLIEPVDDLLFCPGQPLAKRSRNPANL
jgi:hypothetical protein